MNGTVDLRAYASLAKRALYGLSGWGLELVRLVLVGHGIVGRIADKLREAGLLPLVTVNLSADEVAQIKRFTQMDHEADAVAKAAREFLRVVFINLTLFI